MRQAGAIVLGTTNCPEFLMAYGDRQPALRKNIETPGISTASAGGSSGGESAAIAAGLSAGGLGSDGGGSVRELAHFTGICALKPTPGRIPGERPPASMPRTIFRSWEPSGQWHAPSKTYPSSFMRSSGCDDADPAGAPVPHQQHLMEELKQIRIGFFEDDGITPGNSRDARSCNQRGPVAPSARLPRRTLSPAKRLRMPRQLWWKLFRTRRRYVGRPRHPRTRVRTKPHPQRFSSHRSHRKTFVGRRTAHSMAGVRHNQSQTPDRECVSSLFC